MTWVDNFRDAFLKLSEINKLLQSSEIVDVEKIISMQLEAKKLYEYCDKLLLKTEDKINS